MKQHKSIFTTTAHWQIHTLHVSPELNLPNTFPYILNHILMQHSISLTVAWTQKRHTIRKIFYVTSKRAGHLYWTSLIMWASQTSSCLNANVFSILALIVSLLLWVLISAGSSTLIFSRDRQLSPGEKERQWATSLLFGLTSKAGAPFPSGLCVKAFTHTSGHPT